MKNNFRDIKFFAGIDIGSTCAKTVVMDREGAVCFRLLQATGWSSIGTAEDIRKAILERGCGEDNTAVVATGYGRISVPYADKCVTEITCHAKGACHIHGLSAMTVIDIGGQDTKLISVEDGSVKDFVMNDKCSAGTGRFLEIMANTLAVDVRELCALASEGGSTSISSLCTVFAESEVTSLIGRGEKKENIAYAVVNSIVTKVASQAGRLPYEGTTACLTGGLCGIEYLRSALSEALKVPVRTCEEGRYAGAEGAALIASSLYA